MLKDSKHIAEAYSSHISAPLAPAAKPVPNQNNQEVVQKNETPKKDWIRLPVIDTPFKARMAAILIVDLINNMASDGNFKEMVFAEIKRSNRLHKKV